MKLLRILLVCVFATAAHAQDNNLVVNGDFEECQVDTDSWDIFQGAEASQDNYCEALGWTIEWAADTAYLRSATPPEPPLLELQNRALKPANSGFQCAELDSDWKGPLDTDPTVDPASVRISQVVPTIPGWKYTISYAWTPRPEHSDNVVEVWWDGRLLGRIQRSGESDSQWSLGKHMETASGISTEIAFVEVGSADSKGMLLDSVSVQEAPILVDIDVKPQSFPSCFNVNGSGTVPVAILGSEAFDVLDLDYSTLDFGGFSVVQKRNGDLQCAYEDVSGDFTFPEGSPDGYLDLVCHFADTGEFLFDGDTAILIGELYSGMPIEATGEVCIRVPGRLGNSRRSSR